MAEKTKNKKEMMKEKKYDGFAIASFVLGLVSLIYGALFLLSYIKNIGDFVTTNRPSLLGIIFIFFFFIAIAPYLFMAFQLVPIVFGIVALRKIKKNKNLKGWRQAILGIVFALVTLVIMMVLELIMYK